MYKKIIGINLIILILALFFSFNLHIRKYETDIINFSILFLGNISLYFIIVKKKFEYKNLLSLSIVSLLLYIGYFFINIILSKFTNAIMRKMVSSRNLYFINLPLLLFNIIAIVLWITICIFIMRLLIFKTNLKSAKIILLISLCTLVLVINYFIESYFSQKIISLEYSLDKAIEISNIFSTILTILKFTLKSVSLIVIALLFKNSNDSKIKISD